LLLILELLGFIVSWSFLHHLNEIHVTKTCSRTNVVTAKSYIKPVVIKFIPTNFKPAVNRDYEAMVMLILQ